MSALEIAAAAVSFVGIWLTARRSMLCWPASLVACALYGKLFLDVRLYADMALQAVFGGAILYGWAAWARTRASTGTVAVRALSRQGTLAGLAAGVLGWLAIGCFTSRYTNAALPWADAGLTSFSLVAQYWTARRHAASWLLWIAVDTLYVGLFAYKGLPATVGLYAALVALAVRGYRAWRATPSPTA
jgi:nicotinamide mononucleotide transporter